MLIVLYCVFQTERHFIMQVVCEATQCPDTRVSNITRCDTVMTL